MPIVRNAVVFGIMLRVDGLRLKEWFVVPLHVIEEAVNAIIHKEPVEYDPQLQRLIYAKA